MDDKQKEQIVALIDGVMDAMDISIWDLEHMDEHECHEGRG